MSNFFNQLVDIYIPGTIKYFFLGVVSQNDPKLSSDRPDLVHTGVSDECLKLLVVAGGEVLYYPELETSVDFFLGEFGRQLTVFYDEIT